MKFSYSLIKKLLPRVPAVTKLVEALNLHVFEVESAEGDVLDIKLYANRYSDAVSHIGIAREVGAIFGLPFKSPVKQSVNIPAHKGRLDIKVEEPKLCSRYAVRYFDVPSKLPATPALIKKALASCGVHAINPIVDVMNYVMLETGQPLHAFDSERIESIISKSKFPISKKIIIRKAKKGEHIETLDGQKVSLDEDTLLVAGKDGPLAIAGIKGGKSSGVHAGTKSIVVEAANFDAPNILQTSRRLKLVTDAAVRFAHNLSPELVQWGLDRATELLVAMGCELKDSAEYYPKKATEKIISFDAAHYQRLVGARIALPQAKKHFIALGFETSETKKEGTMLVRVPAWRTDVSIPEDLIEEVVRLEGVNALKKSAPTVSIAASETEDMITLKDLIRTVAVRMNLSEIYSNSFVGEQELATSENFEGHGMSSHGVQPENPLSEEFAYLRPSLASGLVRAVHGNARFFDEVRIFEIGAVFSEDRGRVKEQVYCGIALGKVIGKESGAENLVSRELKGIIDEMLREIGIVEFFMKSDGHALRIEADHHVVGRVRLVPSEKGWTVVVAELNLSELLPLIEGEREYVPLSRFPSIMRDVSLLIRDDARIGPLLEAIQGGGGANLEDVDLIDEFRDEKLGGKMSVTFRLVFHSNERTLTDEEVNKDMEKVTTALRDTYGAEVR